MEQKGTNQHYERIEQMLQEIADPVSVSSEAVQESSDRINSKAEWDNANKMTRELLEYMHTLSDQDDWQKLMLGKIEDMRQERKQKAEKVYANKPWDFSVEKALPVFASEESLQICPATMDDKSFFCSIRRYWMYTTGMKQISELLDDDSLWKPVEQEFSFYCMVKLNDVSIGYVAIHDTRESIWEIAAEFDPEYCNKGLGTKSVKLFLKALQEITMYDLYRAKVEVENIASQKCLEKLGAELVGIANAAIDDEEEQACFENENLDRIDTNMIELAEKLHVEPRKLLSHVLEYHLMI